MCVSVWEDVNADAHRAQKMTLDFLELELQAVMSCPMWVLALELKSFSRAVCALDC